MLNQKYVNRFAAIIGAQQPLVDWINSVAKQTTPPGETIQTFTLDYFKEEDSKDVYLLKSFELVEDAKQHLKRIFKQIFTDQLNGWVSDQQYWPKPLTYEMFETWFEVEISSMIIDLDNNPFYDDDADNEDAGF